MHMLIPQNGNTQQLSDEERERIDGLFSAARRFHYWAFFCAGLSLLLGMLEKSGKFILPFGGVEIPSSQASAALYLTAIALVIGADKFATLALYWNRLDTRRPPFAWLPLGIEKPHHLLLTFWLVLPLIGCSIGTTLVLENDPLGESLAFTGVFVAFLPRVMRRYMFHIARKTDERGGRATFSIFLLYWVRLLRQSLLTAVFFLPTLAAITPWRGVYNKKLLTYLIIALVGLYVIRIIGSCVYRRIDRLGGRLGFPTRSEHY